jgi:putative cytoplasmic protein
MNNTTQEPELPSKEHLFEESCLIIDEAQHEAFHAVNIALLKRNWLLGKRLNEELLKYSRADYGKRVIQELSGLLVQRYGKGFSKSNLYNYILFNQLYPDIFQLSTGKSARHDILQSVTGKSSIRLTWTHYSVLLQVRDDEARAWYEQEAVTEGWSVRTLQRNVSSQYYYRLLQSHHKELVREEMLEKSSPLVEKLEFIKSPVVAEFLGFTPNTSFTETDLESSIISNLQKFIMELGKGYAFVGRQQHIHTEKEDYYIDLVFYNYFLKCFVLMDLKTSKVTHQDVGQMDMYVRMFDELKRTDGDNPTIGILLCSDTDEDIARYSILHDSKQLFATKYKLYLPTQEELKAEIEAQKAQFYLQFKGQNK